MGSQYIQLILWTLISMATTGCAKTGYGPGEQDWGYIDIRPGAHMFNWLYYTTADGVANYTERPLAIWLQGGPGLSSTGLGNFDQLGPIDMHGNERNWTWVKQMNVLFIDSPLGSGFSYVDNMTLLPSTNNEIALDLVAFLKKFLELHREFETVPLHIFTQSYGGKMAPEFALELYKAVQRAEVSCDLKSVAIGGPWTSPIDSILARAPLLFHLGLVDQEGHDQIMKLAHKALHLVEQKKWIAGDVVETELTTFIEQKTYNVDFYNILKYEKENVHEKKLEDFMRGRVSQALGIPQHVHWGLHENDIFENIKGEILKPATHIVEELLNKTNVKVSVFTGQLDVICATPGTINWIEKLRWLHRDEYVRAPRLPIRIDGNIEGYEKSGGNFTLFWVNRAGHVVPVDNPMAMNYILKKCSKLDNE
ncbi:retinoid-inducible serine carboxypeptidase [Musca domestica]|uniref:Retinoid-inducible serine carboxypeptidase-like n=1 Tax=Musca domestica TaxID=7370 RepID=A0A1I8M8P6_MUSDO|nr:retinoid-inducible serine carboxypeptidase [Musca domestica]